MAVYLVDFENVHSAGLMGVEKLSEKDSVYIFYSNNSNSMSFEAHAMLKATAAKVVPLHVSSGNKNALDFQLASFVGYLAGTSEDRDVTIISVDTGYTFVQHFWQRTMHCTNFMLRFAPSIKRCLPPESMAAQRLEPMNAAVFAPSVRKKAEEVFTAEDPADNAAASSENKPLSPASENAAETVGSTAQEAVITPVNEAEVTEKIQANKNQNVQDEKSPESKTEGKVIEAVSEAAVKEVSPAAAPKEKAKKSAAKSATESQKKTDASNVKQGKNRLAAIIKDAGIGKVNTNVICDLVADSKDKQQFYTGMTKTFGMNDGLKIYKVLRPEYSNLKKLLSST